MVKFLVPLVLALGGAGTGIGAGMMLRPDAGGDAPESAAKFPGEADAHEATSEESHGAADDGGEDSHAEAGSQAKPADSHGGGGGDSHASSDDHGDDDGHGGGGNEQYVKLGNQFIVPVLDNSRVRSLVVLSIDLEVGSGGSSAVYRVEPKIRDAFLTVLFDHANAGGFSGTFTSSGSMEILRRALREAGQKAVGKEIVGDVLITGIVRQDV